MVKISYSVIIGISIFRVLKHSSFNNPQPWTNGNKKSMPFLIFDVLFHFPCRLIFEFVVFVNCCEPMHFVEFSCF